MSDEYTFEMRMCDDRGIVSDTPIDEKRDNPLLDPKFTYLDRLNWLRNLTRRSRGEKSETIDKPFACTGHGHLIGEHIRCTSPAHNETKRELLEKELGLLRFMDHYKSLLFFDALEREGYVRKYPSGYDLTDKGREAIGQCPYCRLYGIHTRDCKNPLLPARCQQCGHTPHGEATCQALVGKSDDSYDYWTEPCLCSGEDLSK